MDTPTRRSHARTQRRSNNSPYARSKSVAARLNHHDLPPVGAPPVRPSPPLPALLAASADAPAASRAGCEAGRKTCCCSRASCQSLQTLTGSSLPLAPFPPQVASALPRTSSIRSLFNLISSPFRSTAPAASTAQDAESSSNDGFSSEGESDRFSEEDDDDEHERGQQQQQQPHPREEGLKFGWGDAGANGNGRAPDGRSNGWSTSDKVRPLAPLRADGSPEADPPIPAAAAAPPPPARQFVHSSAAAGPPPASPWAAANPLASFSPRVKPQATHAHALLQMQPSPVASQPAYLPRSSTMPALNHLAGAGGGGAAARRVLREAAFGSGLAEEAEDGDRPPAGGIPDVQRLFMTGPAPRAPAQTLRPLFHPGSTTPSRPTAFASSSSLSGSINGGGAGLGRSSSAANLSFLSPSRFAPRASSPAPAPSSSMTTAAASPGTYAFASRPRTGTPARRRPIYVGPGAGSPAGTSARKKTPAMALEFLRAAERKEDAGAGGGGEGGTPGKRRRVGGQEDEGEEARVERELSGGSLFGGQAATSSRTGGLASSASVPSNLASSAFSSSTSGARTQPTSPFTFKPPPPPPPPPAPVPAPAPTPRRSYPALPRAFLKNPSLVAPSPLRQSTSFGRDSPEGAGAAQGPPPAVAGGKRKERTESAKLLLGMINDDKAKVRSPPRWLPVTAPRAARLTPRSPGRPRARTARPPVRDASQAVRPPHIDDDGSRAGDPEPVPVVGPRLAFAPAQPAPVRRRRQPEQQARRVGRRR